MGAPERRYTDADVRSDPELTELAYDYLDNYTGEFEPLVKAQDKVRNHQYLTTAQVRVVLNCMRHDWDIADQLPEPMAKVIEMPIRDDREVEVVPKGKRGNKPSYQDRYVPCGDLKPHPSHNYEAKGYDQWRCIGVKNNRTDVVIMRAKIKVPYAKAKGGKMIHLIDLEGDSNFSYVPNQYGEGYGSDFPSRTFPKPWGVYPRFSVQLVCRYPGWLNDPMLLAEIPEGMITPDGKPIKLCPHCAALS